MSHHDYYYKMKENQIILEHKAKEHMFMAKILNIITAIFFFISLFALYKFGSLSDNTQYMLRYSLVAIVSGLFAIASRISSLFITLTALNLNLECVRIEAELERQ